MTTVVLVGGGHAHLHLVRHAHRFHRHGLHLVLVDPGAFHYSGLATGVLAGHVEGETARIDLQALAEQHGVTYFADRLLTLNAGQRTLTLEQQGTLAFDRVSLNVGSVVTAPDLGPAPAGVRVWHAKPIAGLSQLRVALVADGQNGVSPAICVVGGGSTGCEIAAALSRCMTAQGRTPDVHLITRSQRLLPPHPTAASRAVHAALLGQGVRVHTQADVTAWADDGLRLADGRVLTAAHVVFATGLMANPLVGNLGLASSAAGLRVNAQLQSEGSPVVFAVGDCADFGPRRLPKLGVFGVRAAPVLQRNLIASLLQAPLAAYRPQRRWLSILNLGGRTGLALWGRFWWLGRASLWLKLWLDRRFMRRHRPPAQSGH